MDQSIYLYLYLYPFTYYPVGFYQIKHHCNDQHECDLDHYSRVDGHCVCRVSITMSLTKN